MQLTAKGRATYAAKAGEHDDLVLAVALAVWFAERAGFGRGLMKTVVSVEFRDPDPAMTAGDRAAGLDPTPTLHPLVTQNGTSRPSSLLVSWLSNYVGAGNASANF